LTPSLPIQGEVDHSGTLSELMRRIPDVPMYCTANSVKSLRGQYQENRISIIYDTMRGGTRRIADAIAEGITEADPEVDLRLFNSAHQDKNDIMTEIFRSKAILLGSPTINKGILTFVSALLEEAKGLQFRGKKAAAFGPYGWSGESVQVLSKALPEAGFELTDEGLKTLWEPGEEIFSRAREYGRNFVRTIAD